MTASELMEQGIRAYTRGQLGEAERCWRDVLAVDPGNARAQSYLELLVGKLVQTAAPPARAAPVPLPVPPSAPPRAPPTKVARAAAPVPLPAPAAAARPPPQMVSPAAPPAAPVRPAPAATPRPPAPDLRLAPLDDWMHPPVTLSPSANPVPPDEFASCWDSRTDEITTPITIAEPLPESPLFPELTSAPSGPAPGEEGSTPVPTRDDTSWAAAPTAAPAPPPPTNGLERTTLSEYAPSPWDQGPARAPAVVLDEGVGLDLAMVAEQPGLHALVPEASGREPAARAPRNEVEIWMEGARELFALGDFSGSLEMIEKILKIDPSHAEAREYLKQNEATLIAMYESKLGPSDAVPRLAIQPEEVMWLNLDHRAGFLLAQIDGTVSYEDLFALSGLPRLDTARILATLLQEGVIQA